MQAGRHIRLHDRTSGVLTVPPQDVDRWRLQRFLQVSFPIHGGPEHKVHFIYTDSYHILFLYLYIFDA